MVASYKKNLPLRLKILVSLLRVYSFKALNDQPPLSDHCCVMRVIATLLEKKQHITIGGRGATQRIEVWYEMLEHIKRIIKIYKSDRHNDIFYMHFIFVLHFVKYIIYMEKKHDRSYNITEEAVIIARHVDTYIKNKTQKG